MNNLNPPNAEIGALLGQYPPSVLVDDLDTGEEDGLEITEVEMINDAELIGKENAEMDALLDKQFVFMTGDMYGQRERRNTLDGKWKRVSMPLSNWILGGDGWGLSRHPVSKSKEGSSIVLAEALKGARKDTAIKTMSCIGLDIDSGAQLDDVINKLEELDLFAVVYTSYNHGKSELVLKHDDVMRKMKLEESPDLTQIQMYLREHHKDRFDAKFIETIEIKELRKQTPDGLRTVLKTPPLDKFRVILPLSEPVNLSDLGTTVAQWKDVWADAVTGVAVNLLDVNFDATSCDVNRLFFTPRHRKGDNEWYSAVVRGKPLRFEDIQPHSKTTYVKNRDVNSGPFTMGTGDHQREQFETEDGLNLNRWHRKYKDRFMLADVLESLAIDKIQTGGGDKAGTVTIECPFEHEHSSTGGTATMAMNPGETEVGYWTVFCHHDACQDRDKLEFVKAMVDDGWFPESALTDDGWCVPLADEDLPSPVSSTAITPLSAPLWEDGLVTDGYCKRKKVPLIREQIRRNLRKRLSYVIVEGGKGKLFIHPKRGRLPEIWDDAALDKYYRNGGVVYDIKGANKQGIINPAKEFFLDDIRLTYSGTQFEPDLSKAGKTKYNTFNGFPVSPVRGDWSLLRGHIKDNLCGGNGEDQKEDEDLFNYVMTWCADMFQNPSHKLGSSIAIIGEEGVGKSKFFDWLREGLGDYAIKVASKKHLVGNFNSHLDSKLLVVAEEAFWSGDKEAASILKDFITSDTAMTERKGFDAVERASYTRVGFVTNSDWAVPTGDNADARRFLVLRASNAQKQNGAYFNAIDEQMHNGGLEAMVHELMHWNPADVGLSFDDLRKAPWTAARAEQASYGTSPAMAFLLQTIEDGVFTNRDGMDVELSDTKTTRVNRTELLFAVQGKATHGGARKAAKKVIEQILGDDVWHDNKHLFDDGERKRYVEFPPLDGLRASLKTTYR